MSEPGEVKGGAQRQAREHPEQTDAGERKISDLLGMDKNAEETSREDPKTPPEDRETKTRTSPVSSHPA